MKTHIYKLLVAVTILLNGCMFQVKNTKGLQLAYQDIDLATSKGLELKALKIVDKQQQQEAVGLYQDAKAAINSYLQQAITDAADYTVNEPEESYLETEARKKASVFKAKVDELRARSATKAFPGVVVQELAVIVIDAIFELHGQSQKAAYERFIETVEKYMMKNYTEL